MVLKMIEKIKETKLAKRLNEVMNNEEIKDDDYLPHSNREYVLANSRSKKIEKLSRSYWDGEINRDELVKKIEDYNDKKCDEQREIQIGHVLSAIEKNYRWYDVSIWEESPFTCQKCGCHRLSYQKFVSSTSPAYLEKSGFISYGRSDIKEDDEVVGLSGYVCSRCGCRLYHCGVRIETEEQLISLLTMNPQIKHQQEQDYQNYIDAEIQCQQQKEEEQALLNQEVAEAGLLTHSKYFQE